MTDLEFWAAFASQLNAALKLDQYYIADWLYLIILMTAILCLWRGQRTGKIDLWDMVKTTKTVNGQERVFTDPRKLFEVGAFVVFTCAFSYKVIQGKLDTDFAFLYIGAFVTARALRDREQRLNKKIDAGIPDAPSLLDRVLPQPPETKP